MSENPYQNFFEAFERCFAPLTVVRTEWTPAEMIVGMSPDGSVGWVQWKLLPCRQDMGEVLSAIESRFGCRYPESFKRWYSMYYTLDMDTSVVRLPSNPSNAPADPLRQTLKSYGHVRRLGLLPFADEAMMDAGPVCFDTRGGDDPERWPIVYWDHEWAGTKQQIGPAIFSSFEKLIESCTRYMECFARVREQVSDPERWGSRRGPCMREMMEADRDGAGKTGKGYWEGFIES